MTPFSEQIKRLRTERGYQQTEFALSVGISPCYYSAIENGKKGPPSKAVFARFIQELELNDTEICLLTEMAEALKRTYVMPSNLAVYEQLLASSLWKRLGSITPEQAQCIEMILKLNDR